MRNKQTYAGVTTELGERLAQLYWRQRVSQAAVAEELGVSQSAVSARLRGRVPITVDELEIMARLAGTTAVELWMDVRGGGPVRTDARAAVDEHARRAASGEGRPTYLMGTIEDHNAKRGPALAGPLYGKYAIRDSNPEPAD
ncbi:helix-turn-helix transcriptional regulator [Pimelobacter simplex]|uniref:Helix-turn-helix transcriptional regulator n=1 Tax=Nocardioides simplex TaxID=2045 RepID=A0A7J5DWH7_NOCSI|nr:helix-turn-helix transcriptional regulator [Pimelobacter simplex]